MLCEVQFNCQGCTAHWVILDILEKEIVFANLPEALNILHLAA